MIWLVVLGIVAVVVIALVVIWNTLIILRTRADNAWAQIDVQLKRRADLIPNLVETVKGYMRHERRVLVEVTNARAAILAAKSPREAARAEGMLAGALKTLFAVAENYPALRASENFRLLQEELAGTENKIAYARQLYNDTVMEFNAKIKMIPWSIIAGLFGFTEKEFFKAEEVEKRPVKVRFE